MYRILTAALLLILTLSAACAEPPDEAPQAADAAPDLITAAPDAAPDLPPPTKPLGATCQADAQCTSGICLPDPRWPSGYCALDGCGAACEADGGVCLPLADGERTCAKFCATGQGCRFGYTCHRDRETFATGCIPTALVPPPPVVEPPPLDGATDGSPCSFDSECIGGACMSGDAWPGGFCTTRSCNDERRCHPAPGAGVVCANVTSLGEPQCRVTCADDSACREGYTCGDFDGVNSYCVGPPRQSVNIPFDLSTYPIPLTCEATTDSKLELRYDLPMGDTRHSVVVFSPLGYPVAPTTLVTPNATIDLRISYAFALEVARYRHRWLHALTFPALGALASRHRSGPQVLSVSSASPTLCWYVLSHKGQGRYLDVNIYLPGLPDVTQLSDMPALVSVMQRVNQLASIMSVTVRPRIVALPATAHEALRIARNDNDLAELSRLTQASIADSASPLSLNLILVAGFADPNLLGTSLGLPGAPGLHGLPISAVFATYPTTNPSQQLALANTITHEFGHYLGLRHTSEGYPGTYDPHPDTPTCNTAYNDPFSCQDRSNLMFPYNLGSRNSISPDQFYLVHSNPLIVP